MFPFMKTPQPHVHVHCKQCNVLLRKCETSFRVAKTHKYLLIGICYLFLLNVSISLLMAKQLDKTILGLSMFVQDNSHLAHCFHKWGQLLPFSCIALYKQSTATHYYSVMEIQKYITK